jgi:hypothetical protein
VETSEEQEGDRKPSSTEAIEDAVQVEEEVETMEKVETSREREGCWARWLKKVVAVGEGEVERVLRCSDEEGVMAKGEQLVRVMEEVKEEGSDSAKVGGRSVLSISLSLRTSSPCSSSSSTSRPILSLIAASPESENGKPPPMTAESLSTGLDPNPLPKIDDPSLPAPSSYTGLAGGLSPKLESIRSRDLSAAGRLSDWDWSQRIRRWVVGEGGEDSWTELEMEAFREERGVEVGRARARLREEEEIGKGGGEAEGGRDVCEWRRQGSAQDLSIVRRRG